MQTISRTLDLPRSLAPSAGSARADRADLAACRAALRNGSRTFLAASLLLPRRVRDPACALYAFCRLADDAVDGPDAQHDAVARLRERLSRACAGRPEDAPADRALASVIERFAIPRVLPEALLEGFEWDAAGRVHESFADVLAYAARVAGSVGAMMALLMGVRSPAAVARACDLGVAMQLSNIARDVGEDARAGRLYLPRAWLCEAGIDADAWLAEPLFSPALGSVLQRLLDAADDLYARVEAGIACLPWSCRIGIDAARRLYADIGHEVGRRGLDSVSQRAVVADRRKAWLLLHAIGGVAARRGDRSSPALCETQFLVDAVERHPTGVGSTPDRSTPLRGIGERAIWLMALYERLETRDRLPLPHEVN
ncbi:MAG: phytoene/squalene synthase family protein [Caldimonas sp.]